MFSSFLYGIWYFLQAWIAIYLILPLLFLIIYLVKKKFGKLYSINNKPVRIKKDFNFAAIITAHKETSLIPPLVDSLVKQRYGNILIYVVADACDISELHFDDPRVVILKPENDLNSKIKSIDYAINNFKQEHDALVIFDSDNLAHPDFMHILNLYFKQGFRAVQTSLQAKNTDTVFSRMDSIGDIYYNFTEREIRMEMGVSSAIWGLGIAIETSLYKEIIYQHFLGGFDKRIQADLVRKIPQIAFAKEAYVYDEKITDGDALEKQRTRWINAYFKYFTLGFAVLTNGIRNFSFNRFFFGFINLRPPLFIVVGAAMLFCVINLFINTTLSLVWLAVLLAFVLSFIGIIVTKSKNKAVVRSLFFMPLFVLRQFLALFKIRKANKSFLKTEHTKIIYIDDLLSNETA